MDEIGKSSAHPKISTIPSQPFTTEICEGCSVTCAVLQANIEIDNRQVVKSLLREQHLAIVRGDVKTYVLAPRERADVQLPRCAFLALKRILARAVVHCGGGMVVQGALVGTPWDGHFTAINVHSNCECSLVFEFRNGVIGRFSCNGDRNTPCARSPAVIINKEVVAAVCQATVGSGLLIVIVVVGEIDIGPQVCGQGPKQGTTKTQLNQ